MGTLSRSLRARSFALLVIMLLLTLTACTDTGNSNASNRNSSISITVGGRSDTESQLFAKMYVLLLQHNGFKVTERILPGTSDTVFNAITSGQVDLYPEFTATGLAKLGLYSTGNAQQDYLQIKQGYEARDHIIWLDLTPLNDAYTVCTTRARASSLHATKISDLKMKGAGLSIAASLDGIQNGVDAVKSGYGFTFKKVVSYSGEDLTFPAVNRGTQDLNICHITNPGIAKYNFVVLRDDKNASPTYNLAPVVRDGALKKTPQIAAILNKLAPYLTTRISQQLQAEVMNDGKSVTEVATQFLRSKRML